jgi:hypothetical protein
LEYGVAVMANFAGGGELLGSKLRKKTTVLGVLQ